MRGFAPGVFPIVTTEVARIRGAGRPLVADLFFEAFEFFKAGGENPGSIISVSVGGQPKRSSPRPTFVSKHMMASIHSRPSRVTKRGGVR